MTQMFLPLIVDTGDKIITGVSDTGDKLSIGVKDTSGKKSGNNFS